MTDIERRFGDLQTEVTGKKLGGYAAVFNQVADIGPGRYLERLAPTVFRSVLATPDLDVVGLFNHDMNRLLARTRNGSLRLSADSHGLGFELDLPDTPTGDEVRSMVDAGLIDKCSFSFIPGQGDSRSMQDGRQLITRTDVKRLIDVSVVTLPAYQGTDVSLRSNLNAIDLRSQLIYIRSRVNRPKGI